MKTYEGRCEGYAAIVTVDGRRLNPRHDLWNHSPTGFEWGYGGSGPAQLALAILADHCPTEAEARVERSDFDFNLAVPLPSEPDENSAIHRQDVITASRKKYGTARVDIEATTKSAMPVEKETIIPAVPPVLEISTHTNIKEKIGSEAEVLDYTASYEELFPAIQARADIVLRRGTQTIICQVSATTPAEFEAESVRKFLKSDFSHIAVVSTSPKKLKDIRDVLAENLPNTRIGFYSPKEFISKLADWALNDPDGGTVEKGKPRKRPIELKTPLTHEERIEQEKRWLFEITQAMNRK